MFELFTAYRNYPYPVSTRTRLKDIFRYLFKIPFLERLLVRRLTRGNAGWKKLIPPEYFYAQGSIRTVERDNLNYKLDISRFLDHAIFFCQMKDPLLDALFNQLHPNFVVLDLGAHIGFLTLNFARACPDGFVYAFEPDTQNFESLETNVLLNDLKNIRLFKKALGAGEERAVLYKYFPGNPGTNRILQHEPAGKFQYEYVEVVTVDRMAEELEMPKIDLIKIDVEGYELFALQGAQNVIERWNPILFVELVEVNQNQQGSSALALVDYIESMDYEVIDAMTMKPVDRSQQNYNTDILCFSNKSQRVQ